MHDLNAVASLVSALVVFHRRLALLSAGDAGACQRRSKSEPPDRLAGQDERRP